MIRYVLTLYRKYLSSFVLSKATVNLALEVVWYGVSLNVLTTDPRGIPLPTLGSLFLLLTDH